ncbi:MAG: PqqD family protein [Syntrophales bacterium]|nr:PqqD family protein [Syntrophales bacterium]
MSNISRRSLLTASLALGAASIFPSLKLSEAREFIHQAKLDSLLKTRPVRNQDLKVEPIPNGTVVGHVALNETAAFVFSLCNGKRTGNEIAYALRRKYDLPLAQAKDDTAFTLSILLHLNLVLA